MPAIAIGISLTELDLVLIDREVVRRARIDDRASRSSVVRAAVRELLKDKSPAPTIRKRNSP
jgi:Arc/MetJ-type ribon-helix-helix transcriptional regulator